MRPVLTAVLVCRCNATYLAQLRWPRASLEATGSRRWTSIHTVSPWKTGRQCRHMQKNCEKAPHSLLAILLAVLTRRYNTKHIARWRGYQALMEVNGASVTFKNYLIREIVVVDINDYR